MAVKQTQSSNSSTPGKTKVSRPGIHAKTKTSNNKQNKNYQKTYKGQGK